MLLTTLAVMIIFFNAIHSLKSKLYSLVINFSAPEQFPVLSMAIVGASAGVLLTALLTTQVFSIVPANAYYAKQRLPRSQG